MKTILFLSLMSTYLFANFTSFNGDTYKKDQLSKCESDFLKITQSIESVDGFKVIDGGCVSLHSDKYFKLKFNYLHPITKRIETDKRALSSKEVCERKNTTIENKIFQAGNVYVHSYCENNNLIINQIDMTYSLTRDMDNLGTFLEKKACESFLKRIENSTKKVNAHVVVSECIKLQRYNSDLITYRPVVSILANHQIDIKLLQGKKLDAITSCDQATMNTNRNFTDAGVKLVLNYCVNGSENSVKEYVLYLNPKAPKYVDDYRSIAATSMSTCLESLERIESALLSINKNVLYGYCKKINDKLFMPKVTYLR
jgi:hypothetical protein